MARSYRIGVLGFGRMGSALVRGAVAAGVLEKRDALVFVRDAARRRALAKEGFAVAADLAALYAADFVFVCVKPQQMGEVLPALAAARPPNRRPCFVSIAAGVPMARFERELGPKAAVVRVMPNTPALLGAGVSGVSRGRFATTAQMRDVTALLQGVGAVVAVPERLMDALTAVSGSGPAYFFYAAEAMVAAARAMGFDAATARALVHGTAAGAGRMLGQRSEDAAELRRQVTSPNGTTAAATAVFDERKLAQIFRDGMKAAARRSAELAKANA